MLEAASGAGATISLGSIFPGAAGDDVAGLFSLRADSAIGTMPCTPLERF